MNILYHHRTQGKGGEGVHIRETIKALESIGHRVTVISPPGIDVFEENELDSKASSNSTYSVIARRPKAGEAISLSKRDRFAPSSCAKASESRSALAMTSLTGLAVVWSWISKHAPQIVFELMEIGYNFAAWKNIERALDNNSIDLIYERYAFFLWAGSAIAGRRGIPIILEVNEACGIERQRPQALTWLAKKIERAVFNKADAVIAVSKFLRDEIHHRCPGQTNVHLLPNAVDAEFFSAAGRDSRVRDLLHLNGQTVLGFTGYFSKWDRLDNLIRIFSDMVKERPELHLMIVGDARVRAERGALEEMIRKNHLEKNVSLTGKIDRDSVPYYISAADICVIPHSNPFGSPLVLFEYMAMGKPVVAPNVGPVEDVVTDGVTASLFEMGDEPSFKKCVIELVEDGNKREKIGRAARDAVLENHTWIKNAGRIIDIYKRTAS